MLSNLDNLPSVLDDAAHVHSDNFGGPRLRGEHGENPGAAAHVQDNLPFEQMLVVPHGVPEQE